jgi:predicted membrane-bound mannosyltransferase/DNA-binding beta-propeller fold protein YncE
MTDLTTPEKPTPNFLSRPLIVALNLDWEKAIYIAFILIGIISRFWGLGDRVMSHDESLHTQFSYQFYRGDGFQHTPLMHGPFLFHATALSYWLFGHNDFTARIPAAILGIILVILPYFLRPWLGRIGAIFTSFIFLISPYLLYYSRYIREDFFAIVAAVLVFIFILHYLDRREEKYLWLFVGALSWLFTTKESSFIYVAIFGSFLALRLLPQLVTAAWFPKVRPNLLWPLLIVLAGLVVVGGGFVGQRVVTAETAEITSEGEVAGTEAAETADPPPSAAEKALRWTTLLGVGIASLGLLLAVRALRPHLDGYPEFDIILLFSTLLLPFISPLFIRMVGWNPIDYTLAQCSLTGQESMTALQLFFTRISTLSWWSCTLNSGLPRILFFLGLTLTISILVGLWWDRRRWLVAAVIFLAIFLIFYTSVFTNPNGLLTGSVGSLGYWLEQQGVERGSQPWYYYFFVTPFYEFLPLIFSFLAIRLWLTGAQLNKIIGYWLVVGLLAWLGYSLVNWWFNTQAIAIGQEVTRFPGLLAALLILVGGILFWFLARIRQIKNGYGLADGSLFRLFRWQMVCDFVAFVAWWLILTWAAYSYAGEKMPWLSTHFVIPMGILSGWYFNEKLKDLDGRRLLSRDSLLYLGLTIVLVVAICLAIGPLLLGIVRLGDQQLENLKNIGRVIGSLLLVVGLLYLWLKLRDRLTDGEPEAAPGRLRNALWSLSIFAILSLLTIRFAYLASFPNADYVREYLVYAHGAPAVKSIVLDQVNELSQRLYGDNSIKVAYGGEGVPWPFTWYMRQFPNATYFASNPTASLHDSPIIISGRSQQTRTWDELEAILGDKYEAHTYTYLWWPMEDYRQFSWNALLGDPNTAEGTAQRGLLNPDVRQAIWDIWFHRNFEKYDQTFGKTHSDSQWPLRDELRLYIRKDVLAQLWDHGISPVSLEPDVDPFAAGQLSLTPSLVLHEAGFPGAGEGEFLAPRNVAVSPDGKIFVLDSGNQRVQVFDAEGELLTMFGGPGTGNGEFNAEGQGPWGIAADEEFVYVADTWNHRIQKFTHEGDFVASFGQPGNISQAADQGLGLFFGPRDIVLLADGRLLVSDTGNHRIQIMDKEGNFLGQIGGANGLSGAGLGFFYEPVGLTVDENGGLVVADTWNGRLQQFSPEFFPIGEWPVTHWAGNFSVNNKPYVATDSGGRVYVTDPEQYRVLIFGPNGQYLGKFGQFGTDINSLSLPTGIFIDEQDNIYIADAGNNRILKYPPIFAPVVAPVEEEPVEEVPTEVDEEPTPTIPN